VVVVMMKWGFFMPSIREDTRLRFGEGGQLKGPCPSVSVFMKAGSNPSCSVHTATVVIHPQDALTLPY